MLFGIVSCCLDYGLFVFLEWFSVLASAIGAEDVAHWPYTVSLLVKWVAFLGSLSSLACWRCWESVEFLMLNCSFSHELWAGERLSFEKAHPRYLGQGRPISVSAVPFGPGIDIWRSCRFIGAMMRSLCVLL